MLSMRLVIHWYETPTSLGTLEVGRFRILTV